jgi:hypothetical protein
MRTVSPAFTYVLYFPLISLYWQWYVCCQSLKIRSSLQTIQRLRKMKIMCFHLSEPTKNWSKFMKVMHWLLFNTLTAMQDTRFCINHLLLWWSSMSATDLPCCLTDEVVTSVSCRPFTLLPLRTLESAEHLPCCCGGHQCLLQTFYLSTMEGTSVCSLVLGYILMPPPFICSFHVSLNG